MRKDRCAGFWSVTRVAFDPLVLIFQVALKSLFSMRSLQVLFNIAVIYVQLGLNRHSSQYYEKARLSHLRARTSDLAKGANVEVRRAATRMRFIFQSLNVSGNS